MCVCVFMFDWFLYLLLFVFFVGVFTEFSVDFNELTR